MSFRDCIDNALKEGAITEAQARDLRARMDAVQAELELDYGAGAAEEAARRAFDTTKADMLQARRRKLLQAKRIKELLTLQASYRTYAGTADPADFLRNVVVDEGGKLGSSTVQQRYDAIRGQFHAVMVNVIETFERDAFTRTRNVDTLDDVVRALFGDEGVGDEAKALADAFRRASETARQRFNRAGGRIAYRDDWGMPQRHDAIAVGRVPFQEWFDFVAPKLDRARMRDAADNELTDGELRTVLKQVYDSIRTNGAAKMVPDGQPGGRSKATTRSDPRILHFRDGDAWLAYQRQFGEGDAFAAMMGYLDVMSRDIAAMEILGPNPVTGLRALEQQAIKVAEDSGTQADVDKARAAARLARNTYDVFSGASNVPVDTRMAGAFRGVRNVLTSAQLGGAVISAMPTDIFTMGKARAFRGMRATGDLSRVFHLMSRDSTEMTRELVRAGLIAEGATQVAAAQARYLGEVDAVGKSARIADFILRTTGLSPWTQAARWSFGMDVLGNLAQRADRSIGALRSGDATDRAFARMLDVYGLGDAWDTVRATAPTDIAGVAVISPTALAARRDIPEETARFLGDRILEMVHAETEFAIPSSTPKARALTTQGTQAGTIVGELMRSTAMYKSFAATITQLIISRAMEAGRVGGRGAAAQFVAEMFVGLTLMGAVSVQMKELRAGRDPRPMDSPQFLMAAALQGGGIGIFGDFLFANQNRFGGGLATTLAGPVVGLGQDTLDLTVGNVDAALRGDKPRVGRDAIDYVRRYAPGSNAWYADLVLNRAILDQMQRMVDEDAEADFRRQKRWREREFGNGYWWEPGDAAPGRPPALETALGLDSAAF